MMVDPGRVRALLDRLGEELAHLQRLSATPSGELLSDPDRMAAVKYRFVVAIETCIDLAQHVIASEGLRAPEDFADTFTALVEGDYLPSGLLARVQSMARFRNLLVHGYQRVDDGRVLEILETRLVDLVEFRVELAKVLRG
jgi:uncharacterized protein YutE (UPF0331/DUF86 family)